jgi:hypothetical protein
MREVTMGQRLSFAQPNPTTTKSCHWYDPIPMSWILKLSVTLSREYLGTYRTVQDSCFGFVDGINSSPRESRHIIDGAQRNVICVAL